MGAMTMGKSLYFVTSMLLCAPLHGLKFVLSPLFLSSLFVVVVVVNILFQTKKTTLIVRAEFVVGLPGALDEN